MDQGMNLLGQYSFPGILPLLNQQNQPTYGMLSQLPYFQPEVPPQEHQASVIQEMPQPLQHDDTQFTRHLPIEQPVQSVNSNYLQIMQLLSVPPLQLPSSSVVQQPQEILAHQQPLQPQLHPTHMQKELLLGKQAEELQLKQQTAADKARIKAEKAAAKKLQKVQSLQERLNAALTRESQLQQQNKELETCKKNAETAQQRAERDLESLKEINSKLVEDNRILKEAKTQEETLRSRYVTELEDVRGCLAITSAREALLKQRNDELEQMIRIAETAKKSADSELATSMNRNTMLVKNNKILEEQNEHFKTQLLQKMKTDLKMERTEIKEKLENNFRLGVEEGKLWGHEKVRSVKELHEAELQKKRKTEIELKKRIEALETRVPASSRPSYDEARRALVFKRSAISSHSSIATKLPCNIPHIPRNIQAENRSPMISTFPFENKYDSIMAIINRCRSELMRAGCRGNPQDILPSSLAEMTIVKFHQFVGNRQMRLNEECVVLYNTAITKITQIINN